MSDFQKSDIAPEDTATSGASPAPKTRQAISKARRDLSEEEMNQSGVRLWMMDELDRLDAEVTRLETYRVQFHTADKRVAVLEERREQRLAFEILYTVGIALGVGLLMLAPTLPSGAIAETDIAVGVVLVVGAIIAKWKQS